MRGDAGARGPSVIPEGFARVVFLSVIEDRILSGGYNRPSKSNLSQVKKGMAKLTVLHIPVTDRPTQAELLLRPATCSTYWLHCNCRQHIGNWPLYPADAHHALLTLNR